MRWLDFASTMVALNWLRMGNDTVQTMPPMLLKMSAEGLLRAMRGAALQGNVVMIHAGTNTVRCFCRVPKINFVCFIWMMDALEWPNALIILIPQMVRTIRDFGMKTIINPLAFIAILLKVIENYAEILCSAPPPQGAPKYLWGYKRNRAPHTAQDFFLKWGLLIPWGVGF